MGPIRIDVLGAVSVSSDAGRLEGLDLGGRRCRVALAALALHRHPVPAQRLADIVWNGQPPHTWAAALRNVVRDLRTALDRIGLGEQRLVVTAPAGYGLAAHVGNIDQAEADVRSAEQALEEQRPDAALALADAATNIRGEDLLPQEDAPWLAPHRAALDGLRARALEVIAIAAGRRGDHHRAIAAARALVEDNPIDERGYRLLMSALDGAGDRSGVAQAYERCRAALADQLGIDPSAETVEAYLKALRSDSLAPGTRLPTPTGAFLGREHEQHATAEAISEPGAVTIVGRGGVGKTRLALEVARRARQSQEVRWVGLGTVTDDELVAAHLALELGADPGGDPTAAVADRLAPLGRTVLVLDCCEHVTDGAATVTSALITACPALTVLATSRQPLRVEGERTLALLPLAGDDAAIAILRARTRENGRELPQDRTSRELLTQVSARCAGLPLALELIAAQLVDLSLADLVDELPEPDQHDQLTAVLQHSYDLLEPAEAGLFRRMAVLAGPVSLPIVRSVASDAGLPPLRVTRILRELAAGGLVVADRSGPRWRYQQDDDVRRFAVRQLQSSGEESATLGRLGSAVQGLLPADARAAPGPFAAAVTEVAGSLRALFTACLDGRVDREVGLELAFRLHRYWAATAVAEGRFWLSRLLDGAPEGRWTALATFAHGYLVYWAGDAVEAASLLAAAVERLRGVDDGFAARALIYFAGITDDLDRGDEALAAIREAVGLAEKLGDRQLYVGAAIGVGSVLAERGSPEAADAALHALDKCRELNNPDQLATTLPTAAMICWQVGAIEPARALAAECRPLLSTGARIARIVLMSVSAGIALADDDVAAAVEYAGTADSEATGLGVDRELPLIRCLHARALLAAGDVAGARQRAAAALTAASALSYQAPLALALETAALVLGDRPDLVATAARVRAAGDRPPPPTLPPPPGGGDALEPAAATQEALAALTGPPASSASG